MSKIYEPTLAVPAVNIPRNVPDTLLGAVGKEAAEAAGALAQQGRANAAAWAAEAVPQLQRDMIQSLAGAQAAGVTGDALVEHFHNDLRARVEALRQQMPPYAERVLRNGVATVEYRLGATVNAVAARGAEQVRWGAIGDMLGNQAAAVSSGLVDPADAMAESHAIVNASKLTPEQRQKARTQVDQLGMHYVLGELARHPSELPTLMESDRVKTLIGDRWLRTRVRDTAHVVARQKEQDDELHNVIGEQMTLGRLNRELATFADTGSLPEGTLLEISKTQSKHRAAITRFFQGALKERSRRFSGIDAVAKAFAGGDALNPDDPSHQESVDAWWERYAGAGQRNPAEDWRGFSSEFIARTGIVPKALGQELARGLTSSTAAGVAEAAETIWSFGASGDKVLPFLDADSRRKLDMFFAHKLLGFSSEEAAEVLHKESGRNDDSRFALAELMEGRDVERALREVFDHLDRQSKVRTLEYDPSRPPAWDQARPAPNESPEAFVPM